MAKQTHSSGSETDVSTSTENLTPEEHYVLKTGIRQEPQGEETYLNVATDGLPFSANLNIHNNGPIGSYISPFLYGKLAAVNNNIYAEVKEPISKNSDNGNFYYYSHSMGEQQSPVNGSNNRSVIREKTEMMKANNLSSVIDSDSPYSNLNLMKFGQAGMPPNGSSPLFLDNPSVINFQSSGEQGGTAVNCTEASISLQQPMLNNYLNSLKKNDSLLIKNFNGDSVTLPPPPPPPEYDKQWGAFLMNSSASKSCERLAISRSHPDLSKFADDELGAASPGRVNGSGHGNLVAANLSYTYSQPNSPYSPYRNNTVEMILAENAALRSQLEHCLRKVKNLQNFELEIQKVHQSHEELIKSSEKKEKLERALRYKLEIQNRRLQEENQCLKEQIESGSVMKRENFEQGDTPDLKKEMNRRDVLISRLLAKNKEYITDKDRQEIELQAQRLTLQEQRNHIEILDTALMNAQNNIITLEAELRKRAGFEEKTLFLKKALSNLQLTNDRRLQMEKRARAHLEKEIEELKRQNATGTSSTDNKEARGDKDLDANALKKMIREYDEKIIGLEAEVSRWEHKYLEESTLRSIEVSAASAPKDAKIAALERTSLESEKLIAEARSERLRHMDEIHVERKIVAELEIKLKDAESKMVEKDAMIKVLQNVLQKHSDDRTAVLQKSLARRFPNRHTRSASTMGLVVSGGTANNATGGKPDVLSADFGKMIVSKTSQRPSNLALNSENVDSDLVDGVNNLDEQLKEIDSRLSPKVSTP
ncbi:PREDICTED: angiomotin-like [Rhagoletis zephyria]|uniref:angiomotin-like n=1 Tax=Rhagoletis zephyria TaxID=28612 RepID=UPI0008119A26|nr:PREDICTED: angiomotin-like [Rhagoletis zephyria]